MKIFQMLCQQNLKIALSISFVALLMLFTVSCESDDGGDTNQTTVEVPEGVPSGVIVPVEERDLVLTGFEANTSGRAAVDQRRWKYEFGEVISFSCPEFGQNITGDYYIAFTPSGSIEYTNESGNSIATSRSWEWADGKNAILIDNSVKFTFSELNNNRTVYFSDQSNSECDVTTYESMHEPISD